MNPPLLLSNAQTASWIGASSFLNSEGYGMITISSSRLIELKRLERIVEKKYKKLRQQRELNL